MDYWTYSFWHENEETDICLEMGVSEEAFDDRFAYWDMMYPGETVYFQID